MPTFASRRRHFRAGWSGTIAPWSRLRIRARPSPAVWHCRSRRCSWRCQATRQVRAWRARRVSLQRSTRNRAATRYAVSRQSGRSWAGSPARRRKSSRRTDRIGWGPSASWAFGGRTGWGSGAASVPTSTGPCCCSPSPPTSRFPIRRACASRASPDCREICTTSAMRTKRSRRRVLRSRRTALRGFSTTRRGTPRCCRRPRIS